MHAQLQKPGSHRSTLHPSPSFSTFAALAFLEFKLGSHSLLPPTELELSSNEQQLDARYEAKARLLNTSRWSEEQQLSSFARIQNTTTLRGFAYN